MKSQTRFAVTNDSDYCYDSCFGSRTMRKTQAAEADVAEAESFDCHAADEPWRLTAGVDASQQWHGAAAVAAAAGMTIPRPNNEAAETAPAGLPTTLTQT
jgi:hypothetical protein